jgi:hypothetical protein
MKKEFIESEIWLLTIGGGFQRANVYINGATGKERLEFRKELHREVKQIAAEYKVAVSESRHIDNINRICGLEHSVLANGSLNFGISQKILNLYLKYLWCLGEISTPPHFPVDRTIQILLKYKPVVNWTEIDSLEQYMLIIEHAKKEAENKYNSIAEQELDLFKRSSEDQKLPS